MCFGAYVNDDCNSAGKSAVSLSRRSSPMGRLPVANIAFVIAYDLPIRRRPADDRLTSPQCWFMAALRQEGEDIGSSFGADAIGCHSEGPASSDWIARIICSGFDIKAASGANLAAYLVTLSCHAQIDRRRVGRVFRPMITA